ncbi:DUF378 domain-containing protein [Haloarcula halophila]|uniref:DUF378 domain-containing protein n=1 Tax=Haloarcula TaxID=2237 RepID=UPI0023E443F7|nr:DUF378 domain-containing protein [Halomicroarcula sp. DFY41]
MDDYLNIGTWIVNAIAALNWGLVELTDTNLLTDTAGLDPSAAGMLYVVIGVSGVLSLYQFADMELMEG